MNKKIGYKDLSGWLKVLTIFVSVEVILTITLLTIAAVAIIIGVASNLS